MSGPIRRITFSGDIVSRLQARDESACRELYDEAWESLLAIAAAIVRTADAAEDVVQGVMFRVWQRSDLLSREMNLADYMVTAVRNAALTALRTDSRLRQRHDGLAAELVVTGTRVELPPLDDPHDWNDEIDELRRVVGTLTEHQRTAFTLRYSLGMTNQQIAGELGISLKGAEQLTARLMKLLRERVKLPPQ